MSLFLCSKCGCVENTALSKGVDGFWSRKVLKKLPPLCSECANGVWHGQFPKKTPPELDLVLYQNGYLYNPKQVKLSSTTNSFYKQLVVVEWFGQEDKFKND